MTALALLCESIMVLLCLLLYESAGACFIAIGFVIAKLTGSSVRIISISDSCSGNGGGLGSGNGLSCCFEVPTPGLK